MDVGVSIVPTTHNRKWDESLSFICSHLLAGLAGLTGAPVVAATEGDDLGEGGGQADVAGALMGGLPGVGVER